ncbi:Transcription factor IIIB 90 kDa subunit [Oopsacas minuta]|uniref:Transcription factor IIIB 90 kDa subunit n=1 Tax=Oopsacas minuta TaxID=111878 RepID=A0AAV7JZ21_9METZ|nr:Transcription factor IIIB 90 kDa subunit [Oopsacas minuta]
MVSCKYCGSEAPLETCPERGEIVCTDCGAVCNESNIVTEVSFDKESGGPSVFGQLLYADGLTSYERRKLSKSTAGQAKKRLLCLGAKLRLSSASIETGFSFFKLATSQGLLKGFRNKIADAVLLYITCRLEGTPHMLMDFADILRVNLFTLGRLFLKLTKGLHLTLPLGDPWQYILRFSSKLSLGDKRHEVATTALRLVARMKRDWMNVGRHPCGLYGASLFIAGRLSGFRIHVREISRVVGLHHSTIKKRLNEFKRTPSCALTIDEFFRVDLLREEEPPSFSQNQTQSPLSIDSDFSDEDDSPDSSSFSMSRKSLNVDETIAKARYLQKLKEVGPLPLEPSSQSELERFSFYAENSEEHTKIGAEDELDTTGLDEIELDDYILTNEESEHKTELWMSEFGEYEAELVLRAERRRNIASKQAVCRKKRILEVQVGPGSSTREVLQQVINKTGLHDRLDPGALLGEDRKDNFSGRQDDIVEGAITKTGYDSEDSDDNKSETHFGEEILIEQNVFFEDYDIR